MSGKQRLVNDIETRKVSTVTTLKLGRPRDAIARERGVL